MEKNSNPIIIAGMHRSGTTLLVNILEKLNIFFGNKYGENKEAFPFLTLNEQILRIMGASWDNPYNIKRSLKNKTVDQLILSKMKLAVSTKKFDVFHNSKTKWGWKDPRNSLFLDQWINIFPNAKIIFIYRNPIDVAQSLYRRSVKNIFEQNMFEIPLYRRIIYYLKGKSEYNLVSVNCLIFEWCISLWEYYNQVAIESISNLKNEMVLMIKYEDLLQNFVLNFNKISSFLEVNCIPSDQLEIKINVKRAYSFLKNEELLNEYDKIKNNEIIKLLGYSNL